MKSKLLELVHITFLELVSMSEEATEIHVVAPADFHVHLRQDEMCSLVTPLVRTGGFRIAYVMVNNFFNLEGNH